MADNKKPVIHLEVSNGSFRIPTDDAIYDITVIRAEESSVTRVVEKIVRQEQEQTAQVPISTAPPFIAEGDDAFYKEISGELYHDIGKLAKSLSSTIMDLPAEDRRGKRAELDEAGEKIEHAKKQLKDIVDLTEIATMEIMDQVEKVQDQTDEVKNLLARLKEHNAFASVGLSAKPAPPGEVEGGREEQLTKLKASLSKAREVLGGLTLPAPAAGVVAAPASPQETRMRYLFPLDVVFQTMYELCTNETVKTHITAARQQAATIFTLESFHDQLSDKVASLVVEDNFLSVPLTDIFRALFVACTDDKVRNLFQRMAKNKETIFLDQSLPLEMPPTEEVAVVADVTAVAEPEGASDPRFSELDTLLTDSLALLDELEAQPAAQANAGQLGTMSPEDQAEILNRIEEAFEYSSGICGTVSKITETLSFQDLSGQQILKIIKLLSDFQVQLLAIVVTFGSQLKHKEQDRTLTIEETKRMAQDDVDSYLRSMTTADVGGEGSLDQNSVNTLLAEMGF